MLNAKLEKPLQKPVSFENEIKHTGEKKNAVPRFSGQKVRNFVI